MGEAVDSQRLNTHDSWWDSQNDILKTYSFDYEGLIKYKRELDWSEVLSCLIFPPCFCYGACMYNMYDQENTNDEVRARHIALTPDGIRYVVDKHKTSCRLDQCEEGRTSKTIPYDKITDCDIEEPAGADGCPCCLVQRTMMVFNVDTASEGRALSIWGVDVPYELKQDVWSMKRGEGIEGVDMSSIAPSAVSMVGRDGGAGGVTGGGAGGKSSAETERLLGEILQTLKQQNELIELKGSKW